MYAQQSKGQQELPTQDIYLSVQEVYGASLAPMMHPRHPNAVLFATGPFIVIWDWKADRKQLLRHHRLSVTSMCFSQSGSKMVSADAEQVLVWNSVSWELADAAVRPVGRTGEFGAVAAEDDKSRTQHTRINSMHFLDGERSLVSLEQCIDMKAIQSLRVWQLEERSGIKASAEHGLDQDPVHSLCAQQQGLTIYTCSNGELSAWTCHDKAFGGRFGSMARLWRVECDEFDGNFVDVAAVPAMGWVILPVSHGKILILDDQGNKLRTVTRDNAVITRVCMSGDECLLVGTTKGTVLWYNVPTMDVWRRMPYDLALRDSIEAARSASAMAMAQDGEPSGISGVRVSALSSFAGLCMRYTADQTISVMDLSTGNVCNASFGHINDVLCLCSAQRSYFLPRICISPHAI